MDHRPLGSTGITVSAIGLGLAALGRPGYINLGHGDDLDGRTDPGALEDHTHRMLDTAHAAGVTYFDAARSYGRAEEFLSTWLRATGIAGAGVTVGSKWGYVYTAGWRTDADEHEVKIHTRDNLDRQWEESIDVLGEHLDVYQIHSATDESGVLENGDVLARLGELRDGGIVVGLTVSGAGQAETIRRSLEVETGGKRLFGTVQATWNLLEPSAGPALAEAAADGLGVIVKEAVANGRLTMRNEQMARRFEELAPGRLPDAVAIAAALQQPWASVVLSGAATEAQLESNLGALDVPSEVVESLPDLSDAPGDYWKTRSRLDWD